MSTRLLVGQEAIAAHLGISPRTLRRWLASDRPPPVRRVHGVWYAAVSQLDDWLTPPRQAAGSHSASVVTGAAE